MQQRRLNLPTLFPSIGGRPFRTALLSAGVLYWVFRFITLHLAFGSEETVQTNKADFDPAHLRESGYVLTFNEEFTGSGIDPRHWRTAYRWGPEVTINQEIAYYVDTQNPHNPIPANPFSVQDGTLTIAATPYAHGKLKYASGVITTRRLFSQRYGYFEARMKAPNGRGAWPTFWLLPESDVWPPELDIMEMTGLNTETLLLTQHENEGQNIGHSCHVRTPDMADDFHTYGLLWTKTDLFWYFDGEQVCHQPTAASVRVPMYMLINLAIGSGGWTGTPGPETRFPQTLMVRYVRAYALPASPRQQTQQMPPEQP
jgi:beta-glucanase (GH16 family)